VAAKNKDLALLNGLSIAQEFNLWMRENGKSQAVTDWKKEDWSPMFCGLKPLVMDRDGADEVLWDVLYNEGVMVLPKGDMSPEGWSENEEWNEV
jgi:hypothetical protein